jgi:hypothetical protein
MVRSGTAGTVGGGSAGVGKAAQAWLAGARDGAARRDQAGPGNSNQEREAASHGRMGSTCRYPRSAGRIATAADRIEGAGGRRVVSSAARFQAWQAWRVEGRIGRAC